MKKGYAFVTPETGQGEDVFVAREDLGGAMHGDVVEVKVVAGGRRERGEGAVQRIVKRSVTEIIGTFEKSAKFGFVVPENRRISEEIFIPKKDFHGAQRGDKVVARITKYPDVENSAEGKITEIVSRFGEPGGDIRALARQAGLREEFPRKALLEAEAVIKAENWYESSHFGEVGNRRDLRDECIITIDGADAKDLDDAVSVCKLENGNFLLGVHIADVSHYVTEDGALDREALRRGNSVYLIDQVLPMLPRALSNGICSLNANQDRLTLSVDMEINPEGNVLRHKIYKSVIRSRARMVYTDVSDILEHKDPDLMEKYDDLCPLLLRMNELAGILQKRREARGSLDFDFDEAKIHLDALGKAEAVDVAERRVANRIIEEFMLAANAVVAEHCFLLEFPFVYRVHEKPAWEKMEEFAAFLQSLGLTLPGNPENIHPKALAALLAEVSGKPFENVVSTVMLRSMKKAVYDIHCNGHFGLGLKYYCHFTSPIRRYPDLIIHRIIKETLAGDLENKRKKALDKKTREAAETSTATERQALELEREVEKMKKAEYMAGHVGENFPGIISGVTAYGFYVELANTVEGMVRIDSLEDDYYDPDPGRYRLIGRRTKQVYALGDRIDITVSGVNIQERQIDFRICDRKLDNEGYQIKE